MDIKRNLASMLALLGGMMAFSAKLAAQGEPVRICLLPTAVEGG